MRCACERCEVCVCEGEVCMEGCVCEVCVEGCVCEVCVCVRCVFV